MPIAKVQLEDGRIARFEVPEGTKPEDVVKFAKENADKLTAAEKPSVAESVARGIKDPIDAGAQMVTRVLPEGVVNAVNTGTKFVNELPVIGPITKALGMTPATSQTIDRDIKEAEQDYQARRGDAGFDWARLGGNVAATIPLVASAPATLPGAAASGAVVGALQPVTDTENFASEKSMQAGLGAVGGVGGNVLARGVARVVSPKTAPAVKELMDRGVTPTPGQVMGGVAKKIEEKATSVPLLGDAVRAGQRRAIEQFNQAAYRDVVAPIGGTVPKSVGRDAVAEIGDTVSKAYDDVLAKVTFKADQRLTNEISQLTGLVRELPEKEAANFSKFVNDELSKALGPKGIMDGQTFKTLESDISKKVSRFKGSQDAYQQDLGDAYASLLMFLKGGLERSNVGTDAGKRLSSVNGAWARLVRLERAAGSTGASEGIFTPAQFSAAVKGADRSTRKRAFARGDALMQDLSDAGKSVLGNTYPDSGTAGRLAALLATGGVGFIEPVTAATVAGTAAVGSLPYTAIGQRLMANLLTKRPNLAPQVAAGVRKALPASQAATAGALAQE